MLGSLGAVPDAVWVFLGLIVTWLSGKGVAKLSRKAQDYKTKTDGANTAGQLALDIARRNDTELGKVKGRLDRIERWRRRVLDVWAPEHFRHDERVKAELLKLDPDAILVDAPALPELELEDD